MSDNLIRYDRQMLLPTVGEAGQRKLAESSVLLLGCGALGSTVADMLTRAGVGHLTIVDRDIVETTNLQRQVLFDERDAAEHFPKAEAAKRKLATINSSVEITAVVDDIHHNNIEMLAKSADILIDGLDNLDTRYLANDVAVKQGKPFIYGAAVGTTGMQFTVLPRGHHRAWQDFATPCFQCLFPEPPPIGSTATCDTVGVLGPAVAIVANYQSVEALKLLTGSYSALRRTLMTLDVWENELMQLAVDDNRSTCPCCAAHDFAYLTGALGASAAVLCGRDAVQLRSSNADVDLDALALRLGNDRITKRNPFLLVARVDDGGSTYEVTLFPDGRALIKGTEDLRQAKSLYARFIGN